MPQGHVCYVSPSFTKHIPFAGEAFSLPRGILFLAPFPIRPEGSTPPLGRLVSLTVIGTVSKFHAVKIPQWVKDFAYT
jgi:hypothetical protein